MYSGNTNTTCHVNRQLVSYSTSVIFYRFEWFKLPKRVEVQVRYSYDRPVKECTEIFKYHGGSIELCTDLTDKETKAIHKFISKIAVDYFMEKQYVCKKYW